MARRGEGSVVVRIYGEIRDLASKLRTGGDEVGQFATRSRSLITKSFSDITSIVTSRFGRVGAEAQKSLDGMAARAATTGSGIGLALGAGALAAGAAVVELGRKGIAAFGGLASQIRNVERVSGTTAETASRLTAEFRALGIDTTAGARSFYLLSKNIEANEAKLRTLGVQVARNSDGTVDLYGTLMNVRGAYQGTADAQQRNVIANTALGRSGQALLPILSATSERLNEIDKAAQQHHEWMTQDQIDKAKAMNIATTEAGDAVHGLAIEAGDALAPAMIGIAKDIEIAIGILDRFGHGVMWILHHIPGANWVLNRMNQNIQSLATQSADATGAVDDLSGSIDDQADAAGAASSALDAYRNALDDLTASVLGIPNAMDDVNQAFIDLEDNSQTATTKAANAQTKLADAIESANRRIRDAEQEVSDAREDLNKQASGDRTDARRRLRDAEERLSDAHADSAKSIAEAKSNADDLGGSIKSAKERAIELDRKMGDVVGKVEKTVEEMIKQKRPTSEILAYIVSQRDRLGEIATKIGANKTQLQLYLDVLTKVYQTTKDLASLPPAGSQSQWPGVPYSASATRNMDGSISYWPGTPYAADERVTINQYITSTTPAEQQRQASKQFNGALRRRG